MCDVLGCNNAARLAGKDLDRMPCFYTHRKST